MVNREDEGFAHAFYLLHGLAVGAIALRVADAEGMTARAKAMLASPFVGPIGKGELKIPAVRGVAGSLLYFIDRPGRRGAFFDVDFVPDPEPEAPPALGLERIDHIAQVVAGDRAAGLGALLPLDPRARARRAHRPHRSRTA